MKFEEQRYSYLVIQDLLGVRQIPLEQARYLVGGSAECDIQLISPTAHECYTLFIRCGNRYRVRNVDLQKVDGKHVSNYEYELQHGDRIVYAPNASAVYYTSREPPQLTGVGAKLPIQPSWFPSATVREPFADDP